MLIIREAQMRVFEEDVLCRWIQAYLDKCYPPERVQPAGSARVDLIRAAVKWARARGFQSGRAVRKYVHVSFLLGLGFEIDPRYEWAARILESRKYKNPSSRLRLLEDEVLSRLGRADA